jgi:hypothetical protein
METEWEFIKSALREMRGRRLGQEYRHENIFERPPFIRFFLGTRPRPRGCGRPSLL